MSDAVVPSGRAAPEGAKSTGRFDDEWNAAHRGEGTLQRADRNFAELLQELRVAQTGVQILFAFLLGLSFTPRFADISRFQLNIYVVTLVASALSVALLIAPVAAHRLQFQHGRKVELVRLGHRCALGGLAALLITMTGALLLVLDMAVSTLTATVLTSAVATCFLVLWVVLPLVTRSRRGSAFAFESWTARPEARGDEGGSIPRR